MVTGRRKLITGISLTILGLSGCFGVNSGGTTDIAISNETSSKVTVTIQVTQLSTETQLLDETVTIDANGSKEYEEVVSDAEVHVSVSVQGGSENTDEWFDGENDAEGLHIDITADSITFSTFVK